MGMPRHSLNTQLKPEIYRISVRGDSCTLFIKAKKLPPPSKRITLHQKGLKITSANLTRLDKKGDSALKIIRINHLPTFEQVRLHTNDTLFPGNYTIEIEYKLNPEKLKRISPGAPLDRSLVPSVDEPDAWESAKIEIKQ